MKSVKSLTSIFTSTANNDKNIVLDHHRNSNKKKVNTGTPTHRTSQTQTSTQLQSASKLVARHKEKGKNQSVYYPSNNNVDYSNGNNLSRKNSQNNLSVDYKSDYDEDDDDGYHSDSNRRSSNSAWRTDQAQRPRRVSNRAVPPPPVKVSSDGKQKPGPPPSPPPSRLPPTPNRGNKPKTRPNVKSNTRHRNNHNKTNVNQMNKATSYDNGQRLNNQNMNDLYQPQFIRQQQSAPINNDYEDRMDPQEILKRQKQQISKSHARLPQTNNHNGSNINGWNQSHKNSNDNDIIYINEQNVMTQLQNGNSVSRIITETKRPNYRDRPNGNNNNNNNNNNNGKYNNKLSQLQQTERNQNPFTFVDPDDENENNHIDAHRRGHRKQNSRSLNKKKKKGKNVGFAPDVNINNTTMERLEYGSEYETDDSQPNGDNDNNIINLPESLREEQTALQDLHDTILIYQQAIHDVHQAIVDVKETSQDITYKVKSVTEQLHMIIDRREDELLDEITKKTASKIFALDSQFTKLTQRLMFCREARDEAEELLAKHDEYNDSPSPPNNTSIKPLPSKAYPASGISSTKTKTRHSGGSVTNYNARKDRIMAIVHKAKQDAKNEFEKDLNRGTPVVNTRFHVEHYDITEQLETLGNIIEDEPLQVYQIYPPAITKTKAFKRSVRVQIKSREKIDHDTEHQVLAVQFEPQLVFATAEELGIDNNSNQHPGHRRTESHRAKRQKRQSITSLPEHLTNPETLNWQSLGWIELNPAPVNQQMFGKAKNKYSNELDDIPQSSSSWDNNTAMSNLQKLKKELDLDHIITEHTKLITGLTDILTGADGKYTYIRVRMRKLVKFEEDVHNTNSIENMRRKNEKKKRKSRHSRKNKSSNNLLDIDYQSKEEEDYPPFWIESHFSRPVRLFLRNTGTQTHGLNGDKSGQPLPSLADLSMTTNGTNHNQYGYDLDQNQSHQLQESYDDDWGDMDEEKEANPKKKDKKKKKKKKKKEKKRRAGNASIPSVPAAPQQPSFFNDMPSSVPKYQHQDVDNPESPQPLLSRNRNQNQSHLEAVTPSIDTLTPSPKSSLNFVDEDSEAKWDEFPNMNELIPPNSLEMKRSGSLYDADSDPFTKQRRHSNFHMQDELYQPGILLLDKSRIIWHDIVNNQNNVVSDKIPVAARSSCGMVVAHDVLVADDEYDEEQEPSISRNTNNDINTMTDGGNSRYTSIMFRIGGTLNKKTDRSVDMLDLGTGMWSSLPGLKHARSWCQPALMNGNIVCAGGCGRKTKPISSVELFDFEEARWTELKPLQEARWGHAVYVMYYEDNEQIARTPSLVSSVTSVPEHAKLIVAGGWSKKKKNLQTAEIFDISTNKWQYIAPMNVPRSRCVAMEWTSIDRVGVIGGWGKNTKIVEYYDSNKDAWYRLRDLNHEHVYPSCGLLNDQHLYAMNRFLESEAKQVIKLRHQQEQNAMMQSHKISLMRGRPLPFVLGSNDQLSNMELFDDRSNQWIILQTFPHSQNTIHSMIECALPQNVTSTLTQRTRGYSSHSTHSHSHSRHDQWQRRGSKILGML